MNQVQPIEGITPQALWTTVGVLLALAGIAIVVFKIIEFIWKAKDRKEAKTQLAGKDLTDIIADKVTARLEPRLAKMEEKLSADKQRLDNHERQLNDQEQNLEKISKDTQQIMDVLDGLLMHFISGNDLDKLKSVKKDLDHYKNSR